MSEFETGPWQVQRKALEGFLTQVSQQAQHVSERHGEVLDAAMSVADASSYACSSLPHADLKNLKNSGYQYGLVFESFLI